MKQASLRPLNIPNTSDAQLEALLGVREALDRIGVLENWNRAAGKQGASCDWTGVDCLSNTKKLWRLNMWYKTGVDGLQGTLPAAAGLHGLSNLTSTHILGQPGLRGTPPTDWSGSTQLSSILVGDTSLSGTIPSSYANLARLKEFYAWRNDLSGSLPSSFSRLKALADLEVNNNRLSGTISQETYEILWASCGT